jgi:hypothetical protein
MQDDSNILQHEKDEYNPEYLNLLQKEYQKLFLENAQLKQTLEKEQFLHQNLYRQWSELNNRAIKRERDLQKAESKLNRWVNFYRYSFYVLLVFAGVSTYFLIANNKKSGTPSLSELKPADTISKTLAQNTAQQSSVNDSSIKGSDTAQQQKEISNSVESALNTSQKTGNKNLVNYRVRVKTFFYNNPDENSRRNTFLLPYTGDYGVITALDDKNDFIYIVFTNHAGRISKGWIRKTDLDPINQ